MKHGFAIVAYLALVSASHASVIWDESIDGDLLGTGQNIGPLQLGTNTFRGNFALFRSNGNAANADTDSGFVDLANGLSITSMDAEITSTYGFGVVSYTRFAGLHSPSVPNIYDEEISSDTVLIDLLPYNETGTYRFFIGGGSAGIEDDVEFYWDWEINIEVARDAVIPEPTAFIVWSLLTIATGSVLSRRNRGARLID